MKSRKGAEKRGHWSVMVAEEMLACGLTGWWSELREWVEWLEGVWRGVCGVLSLREICWAGRRGRLRGLGQASDRPRTGFSIPLAESANTCKGNPTHDYPGTTLDYPCVMQYDNGARPPASPAGT